MKKELLVFLGMSVLSSSVMGANQVPKKDFLKRSALEVLNLPAENRRQLAEVNAEKYPQFLELAFDQNQPMSLRWRALVAASDAKGSAALKDILKAADSKEWFMRNAALVAVNSISISEGEKLAQKLISDKALVVRSAAVEILQNSKDQEIRNTLWVELNKDYNFKKKQSLWIRPQIVKVLAKTPKDAEIKDFMKLLDDKDLKVHPSAVAGLEKLTGVKLGEGQDSPSKLVGMWKDYLKETKVEL